MKFFVDDERSPRTEGWIVTRNATDAKEALLAALCLVQPIEILSLDHDLGEPKETNNGYAVACFLEREVLVRGGIPPAVLQVHSGNTEGVRNIVAAYESIARFCEANGMEIPTIHRVQPLDVALPL